MKTKLLISGIVATLLFQTATLMANEDSTVNTKISTSMKKSLESEIKAQKNSFKEAPKEIVDGFNQTLEAIANLQKKSVDKAKEVLKKAKSNFDKALKDNPELNIVPFRQEIVAHEFLGSSESIKKTLFLADTLILKFDTQKARTIIMPLRDEIIVTTDAIPMKLYPIATENALKALEAGDNDKALEILTASLNTVLSESIIVPLPLLVANDLVQEASKLDKSKKDDALLLLNLAQDELKKALYLGYTKIYSKEYKGLEDEIEAIKKEIKGKNIVEKLYDKIKESFKSLISHTKDGSNSDKNSTK